MSERSALRLDVAVGVIIKHEGVNEPALSRNLSPRGMFVATQRRWPIGTVLNVEIVHQTARLPAQVRVANHAQGGVGFEFVDPQRLEKPINALLQRFLPLQDTDKTRVSGVGKLTLLWSPVGASSSFWSLRSKANKAQLIDLSLDGAALVSKKPPEIGEELVVQLPNLIDGTPAEGWVSAQARVVRHTDRGFAVQFLTPSTLFRRCVSEIRRAARKESLKDALT